MSESTWRSSWQLIKQLSPTCRVDLCVGGEPTLNKQLADFLRIAREISPLSQIQITTNGTQIVKGVFTYRQLLEAGANIVYTDMYSPLEKYVELAEASGFPWYEYYKPPENAPSPWTYYGPDLKMIVLQEQPENWPKSRFRAGLLGTWYNHLDWKAAERFGLYPVEKPLTRRCNQPFLYVTIDSRGNYLLCCQDNTGETSGLFPNVKEGLEGFRRFWYGKDLQTIRRRLRLKNRAATSYCSRCCVTFSRCDFLHWTDEQVDHFWNGSGWENMPPYES
jgi:hypothetical protein